MDKSILITIKKLLGIEPDYDAFDTDIIVNINSALMFLDQLGVSKDKHAFYITGSQETWYDLFGDNVDLQAARMYIYLRTRLAFDPPTNSFLVNSIEKQLDELTFRIIVQYEGGDDYV